MKLAQLLHNPGAGDEEHGKEDLIAVIKANGFECRYSSTKKNILKNLDPEIDFLVVAGGDGTLRSVAKELVERKIIEKIWPIGLLPLGTANNIAKSLGIPKDLAEACTLIASENTLKLDVGQVKTRKGRKFIFFEMATIGLSAAVYPDANKAASGKLSSIKAAAMTFIHQDTRPKVYLTLDDESKVEVETMLVMVSNTPVFGKNFLVAPDASLQDGLMDISVYPDFSKVELIRYYAAVMDGGYSGDAKVQHYQARKLKVKASPKLDVMADGVALGKGTVTIKIRPGALRVITAEKNPGFGIPLTDEVVEIQPVPVSLTVGKTEIPISAQ